ncbi:cytochrome c biogenesis protein CcsA [Ferruginibacter lapsinanis]|uniref:cytochrome c biogenesis protein CcsA n=1 Tax=Ferruginibacter lapsinanis TaxID=563172 RepID=UPI001E5B7A3F|nr:cytochrome c biogenesis protein CcsA [Ferruginibacter lapsinanis]UEG48789.1 cytochrome c biogenesis protein CcsA [Ferruginibacter lapsinanis]
MQFEGEHLWLGELGHFFVLLAFTSSLLSAIAYFIASRKEDIAEKFSWIRFARVSFLIQTASVLTVFGCIFYICANHYLEYFYAYKHTSKELEFKYLLACIWEDQGGSFLLWSIWHCILGIFLIKKTKEWEAPVMTIVSLAQVFLAMMIMGVYLLGTKIGNSPFVLTRNEINGPIFSRPDYLTLIKDGIGLNVLLRNYWMVIHPPVLFLGFASTIIPFAFAYAGIQTKRFGDWVKPALPYALFSACILGVGIMMGGKWAYESLSFGGYWAWDPVENASLVPWLILVAGLHTMVVYKATSHSLRASYLFAILTFVFILYSTFLTRTGILGDTSVHAFTEAGNAMNNLIKTFLWFFTIGGLGLFFIHYKKIPAVHTEEKTNSREFWMFIGSLVFFLSAIFIIGLTSLPVYNKIPYLKDLIIKINGGPLALPEDPEFAYNKVMVMVAIIIGVLSAITQYFKYKNSAPGGVLKKIAIPTLIAALLTVAITFIYPITYYKQGYGYLGAIYLALFATTYSIIANAAYIWSGLNGKMKGAGGSVAHLGFALMIAGMLISAGNKKVISEDKFKDFIIPMGIDPLTKQQDNPAENMNLIRQVSTKMGPYEVTYLHDSVGKESNRRFYNLLFVRKDAATKKIQESFILNPDVYLMKDNNMSSNPDTKNYFTHDVFTYISYALNPDKNVDTAQFKLNEINEGDTMFYSKGYLVLNKVIKNPERNKFNIPSNGATLLADITVVNKDSSRYASTPMIMVDSLGISQIDDTVYAQNLFVKFAGVTENRKIKIGIKESDKMIDFVTIKAYIFPYINLVWIGLILMAVGFIMSMLKRTNITGRLYTIALVLTISALFYMFLLAN